jgi:hypothetical protein
MKTVIEMAREANSYADANWALWPTGNRWKEVRDERFAELVRSDAREACAKVCEEVLEQYRGTDMGKHAELVGDACANAIRRDAITAIKKALAAPVQEPVGCEGAIVNGRVYADRLEHDYKFECEAGPLHLCNDWVEFRRCFEWLATHTTPPAQEIVCSTGLCHYKPAAQPAPEQYTALEQALTRLQKRYGELEAKAAVLLRCWLTDEQKLDVVADYFDHVDGDWAVKKASQLLDAYEAKLKELNA